MAILEMRDENRNAGMRSRPFGCVCLFLRVHIYIYQRYHSERVQVKKKQQKKQQQQQQSRRRRNIPVKKENKKSRKTRCRIPSKVIGNRSTRSPYFVFQLFGFAPSFFCSFSLFCQEIFLSRESLFDITSRQSVVYKF